MLDRNTLIHRANAGEKFTYLYFWGHTMPEGGPVTKACLSQWCPRKFVVDGQEYATILGNAKRSV
jgi:predicted NAD-dependent protein-ADP-ribosyltransferase YbiA (DUF1768 family)